MKKRDMQSAFLNEIRKSKTAISLHLKNGKTLKGELTNYDTFTLVINYNSRQQIIYKSEIATITPQGPLKF
ncbi:RNA chaperone Hfq [Sutcliffiella sp. NPDC057660]|uniref:RNA chaperone Hfq n=1 Tax=Sutcliffiella sp. NPDC057660 TaxID=3346199 RepID=UPI0036B3382E